MKQTSLRHRQTTNLLWHRMAHALKPCRNVTCRGTQHPTNHSDDVWFNIGHDGLTSRNSFKSKQIFTLQKKKHRCPVSSVQFKSFEVCSRVNIRLMEEILHQLIGSLSHRLQDLMHPKWPSGCLGFLPSTVCLR